jgi:hypothetical protein
VLSTGGAGGAATCNLRIRILKKKYAALSTCGTTGGCNAGDILMLQRWRYFNLFILILIFKKNCACRGGSAGICGGEEREVEREGRGGGRRGERGERNRKKRREERKRKKKKREVEREGRGGGGRRENRGERRKKRDL